MLQRWEPVAPIHSLVSTNITRAVRLRRTPLVMGSQQIAGRSLLLRRHSLFFQAYRLALAAAQEIKLGATDVRVP